jgi:hypothetical protein
MKFSGCQSSLGLNEKKIQLPLQPLKRGTELFRDEDLLDLTLASEKHIRAGIVKGLKE